MKDTARQSDGAAVGSEYLLGTIGHQIDPIDAGSASAPFRGFSGDESRASAFSAVSVPTNEVHPAARTTELPDKPGYPQPYRTYEDGTR